MRIETARVGAIEVEESHLIAFPSGLIGLPEKKRFVLLEFDRNLPLAWLQNVDHGDFGLPVAEPGLFVRDYRVETPAADVADLDLERAEDAVLLIVTTIAPGGSSITGNLRAPLVVNATSRRGRQIVLARQDLGFRVPADPLAFAHSSAPGSSLLPLTPVASGP